LSGFDFGFGGVAQDVVAVGAGEDFLANDGLGGQAVGEAA
jgi:hypothetical protein